jgi:hypothetical protein
MEVDPIYGTINLGFNDTLHYTDRFNYLQNYSFGLPTYGNAMNDMIYDEASIENAINKKYVEVKEKEQEESQIEPSPLPRNVPQGQGCMIQQQRRIPAPPPKKFVLRH